MKNIIKFILDEKITEIDFGNQSLYKPTTTVLNYLRSLNNHKGVKEGCAEGDCGACTIVVAEILEKNKLEYKTVDSCLIFLPMIHGKQVITVEGLATIKNEKKELHFVQQALVESNGTQCGYCTPGIVMSLFGIYKNGGDFSFDKIKNSLAGNLCRCTGYESIVEASKNILNINLEDKFSENEPKIIEKLNQINNSYEPLIIDTGKQKYFKSFLLKDALLFRKQNPEAIIVNGSTDVALRQNKKNEFFSKIIDISSVKELKNINESSEFYIIGSGVTLEQLKTFSQNKLPYLFEVLNVFASLQIRNYATIGGNIASASPIGDILPLLFVLNARLKLKSIANERIVGVQEFIIDYRKTNLKNDELICEILIPKYNSDYIIKSYKVSKRKDLDISTVHSAFKLKIYHKKVIEITIAYGGMAALTKHALSTEKFLLGKLWERSIIEKSLKILEEEFTPLSDARASNEYRKIVAKNLLLKFFIETQS